MSKVAYPFIAVLMAMLIVTLTGCSMNPLDALSGKPEVSAQVGAENVKQTVGVTAKADTSSKQETTIKDSKVDKVDTSNKKQVSTSTIQANEIKAESFQVVQGGSTKSELYVMMFVIACFYVAGWLSHMLFSGNKKGA